MSSSSPMSTSQSPSLALHEKEMLFTDWGLIDGSEDTALGQSQNQAGAGTATDLGPAEREHRRKSRAFAAAAKKAAAEKRRGQEKVKTEESIAEKKAKQEGDSKDDKDGTDDDDIVEIIDLTRPPTRRPPAYPPRRTVSTTIESVRASSATLRRTSSNPLPTGGAGAGVGAGGGGSGRETLKRKRNSFDGLQGGSSSKSSSRARSIDKSSSRTKNKNKPVRDPTPPLVPEPQRIFAGLAFYYLPDAALGARKLRIAKARQHGARWVRSLGEATHVVVDKQLRWAEIEAVVVVSQEDAAATTTAPPPPILVNDEYPLDCIGFRCLLNPEQRRYRITGWPGEQPEQKKEKENEKEMKKARDNAKDNKKDKTPGPPPSHYSIKPDRQHKRWFGAAGSLPLPGRKPEHMIRKLRKGGG